MVFLHSLHTQCFKGTMFHAWIVELFSAYYCLWPGFFEVSIDCLITSHKAFTDKCFPVLEADAAEWWQTPTSIHMHHCILGWDDAKPDFVPLLMICFSSSHFILAFFAPHQSRPESFYSSCSNYFALRCSSLGWGNHQTSNSWEISWCAWCNFDYKREAVNIVSMLLHI